MEQAMKQARSYSNINKKCNLYLWEKFLIICKPEMSTLNHRNELILTCRHSKKFLLKTVIAWLYFVYKTVSVVPSTNGISIYQAKEHCYLFYMCISEITALFFWQLPDDCFVRSMKLGVANKCVSISPLVNLGIGLSPRENIHNLNLTFGKTKGWAEFTFHPEGNIFPHWTKILLYRN